MSASRAVRIEWQRRVSAEYAICLLAQTLAHRLSLFGAPPELIEGTLSMALDELEHAKLARVVAEVAGAVGPSVYDPLGYSIGSARESAAHIAVLVVPSLCLGETLATRFNHNLRQNARIETPRNALDRVATDEPRHAALGWQILDWLLDLPQGDSVRDVIDHDLAGWVTSLKTSFVGEPALHLRELTAEDLTWGLAIPDDYSKILRDSVDRDWVPRLARRGFSLD